MEMILIDGVFSHFVFVQLAGGELEENKNGTFNQAINQSGRKHQTTIGIITVKTAANYFLAIRFRYIVANGISIDRKVTFSHFMHTGKNRRTIDCDHRGHINVPGSAKIIIY